jgi:hypothetical protein
MKYRVLCCDVFALLAPVLVMNVLLCFVISGKWELEITFKGKNA